MNNGVKELEDLRKRVKELEEENRILKLEKKAEAEECWEAICKKSKLIDCIRMVEGQIVIFKGMKNEVSDINYREMKVKFVNCNDWVNWRDITFPCIVDGE